MSVPDLPMLEKVRPRAPKQFTSYSLNFEDVILNRLFPAKTHGFYVDVGAGHPRFENDLYAFYERGWRGINVEPNENFFRLHQEMRPGDRSLCSVLSDTAGEPLTYYEIEGSGLSTCDEAQAREHAFRGYRLRSRTVQVATLAGVLTESGAQNVDILKVDVEGFEEKVLSGNDWERFRPSVVLVEATYPESRERRPTNIRGFMEQRGYRHVHFDGLNDFYVERDFSVPDGLTLPPNVFDYFVPREIADLRAQVTGMRNQAASLDEEIASLRAVYQDALRAVESLAAENRRLGNQSLKLANESGRYRKVADQLRNELTVLNRWLEPMHAMHEQLERVRRHYAEELGLLRAEMSRQYETMQGARNSADAERRAVEARLQASADAERRAVEARLQAVYLSRSWLLTKPWRATGRWIKRLVR